MVDVTAAGQKLWNGLPIYAGLKSYGEDTDLIECNGPGMEGWVPAERQGVLRSEKIDLILIDGWISGSLFSEERRLLLHYRVKRCDGVEQSLAQKFKPAVEKAPELRTLDQFICYLENGFSCEDLVSEIESQSSAHALRLKPLLEQRPLDAEEIGRVAVSLFAVEDGLHLTPQAIYLARDILIARRAAGQHGTSGQFGAIEDKFLKAIENAYILGRHVREAELKIKHEPDATRGAKFKPIGGKSLGLYEIAENALMDDPNLTAIDIIQLYRNRANASDPVIQEVEDDGTIRWITQGGRERTTEWATFQSELSRIRKKVKNLNM